jgi:predicted metal-dependent phosphoesterase TrpH
VLAHPARYGLSQTKLRALLADFKAAGGQAMEVSTANEKPNIIQNLAALAQRFDYMPHKAVIIMVLICRG